MISFLAPFVAMIVILHFGQNLVATLPIAMPYLFFMCGIAEIIMAIARGLTLRETYVALPSLPSSLHTEAASGLVEAGALKEDGSLNDCEEPKLRSRSVVGFYIFLALAAVMSAVITYFIPLYGLIIFGNDTVKFSILFAMISGVQTLVWIPTGRLADSSRKKLMLLISVLIFASSILLLLRATNFDDFVLASIPFSAGIALLYNTEFTMIACYATRRNRSTAFSIQTAINDITSIPWSLVGGLLFTISPQLPFLFSLIVAVPLFASGLFLVHEPPKPTAL